MKRTGIWLSLVFLASVLVVPTGYSNAQMENETNSTTPVNASTSGQENVGQQISAFVHQAIAHFKQQREDTSNAIKECREKIRNATADTRSQVTDECHKKLQSLKEKYKEEPVKFQQEMGKVWKKAGVNPLSGCWPMFPQILIFFGFYNMLGKAVELRHHGFWWVKDLSQPTFGDQVTRRVRGRRESPMQPSPASPWNSLLGRSLLPMGSRLL